MEKIRLQKYMSENGIASRRKSEEMIETGKVKVNGRVATLGDKVDFSLSIGKRAKVVKDNKKSLQNTDDTEYQVLNAQEQNYIPSVAERIVSDLDMLHDCIMASKSPSATKRRKTSKERTFRE